MDISTDIYQIAGRIRTPENPFRNKLIHIFNTTGKRKLHLDIAYEEFKQTINELIEGLQTYITLANTNEQAKKAAEKILNNNYIMQDENGNYLLNDMLVKLELFNYKIEEQIYKTGVQLKGSYNTNGISTTDINYIKLSDTIEKACRKLSFREAYLKYSELKQSLDFGNKAAEIAAIQPLVVDAYNKLGDDKVRELRYVKKHIEKALINADDTKSQFEKVGAILMKSISYPKVETCPRLIHLIGEAYRAVGIKKEAKAADITNWFECKKTSTRIEGVSTTVYKIFRPKLIQ